MNKREIQKYFDRRPSAQELYVVNDIPFINLDEAQAYADHTGSVVETKHRDDPDDDDASKSLNTGDGKPEEVTSDSETDVTESGDGKPEGNEVQVEEAEEIELQEGDTVEDVETGDVFELKEGELQKVPETEQAEAAEENQERGITITSAKKKNAPRKNLGK